MLRNLTLRRGGRLHWRDETSKRRDLIAQSVAVIDMSVIVIVGSPVQRSKQERARRFCLERLLFELNAAGAEQVWFESRAAAQDDKDRRFVDAARRKGLIPNGLRVDFVRPKEEPMLWLPDAVAGAVTASRLGEEVWLKTMSAIVIQHLVDVR